VASDWSHTENIPWTLPHIFGHFGGSEFEAVPTLPPAIAHRIASLAHTLREGFRVRTAESYCEFEPMVISSIRPERQIESQCFALVASGI
jgi:hypothetical protein